MITKPTVLILGAGSSIMYGFPSGDQLRQLIIRRIEKETRTLFEQYYEFGFRQDEVKEFAAAFSKSGVTSIDAFLEHRAEYMTIGKTAIAEALIPYEREDTLFGREVDWYGYLLDRMNVRIQDFLLNCLTILTFNYDRSLEIYLMRAIAARFGISVERAVETMKHFPVIHLHGKLGNLPWENEPRSFLPKIGPYEINAARMGIKIIHEDPSSDPDFVLALEALQEAQRIVFLGFSYHPTNVARLQPTTWGGGGKQIVKVFGSAFGMTNMEKKIAQGHIGRTVQWGKNDWDVLMFLREMIDLEEK